MDFLNVRLEQEERKMDPYWWIVMSFLYIAIILLCFSFVVGPFILIFIFKKLWMLTLFILTPIGLFLGIGILMDIKPSIRKNRHNSVFTLDQEQLFYKQWNKNKTQVKEGDMSLGSIDYIVLSNYVLENSHLYMRSGIMEKASTTSTFPVIYIRFDNQVITIPFYDDFTINQWIKKFQTSRLSLFYTKVDLWKLNEKEKLERLNEDDILFPYTFGEDWSYHAVTLFDTKKENETDTPVDTNTNAEYIDEVEEEKEKEKRKSTSNWLRNTLIVYLSLLFLIAIAIFLAEESIISYESLWPGLIILLVIATLHFSLKGSIKLRWYHMISFCIVNFIIILIAGLVVENKSEVTDEFMTNTLGSSMLFVAFVWIPFLLVSFIHKKKKNDKE